jgi:hypothetical protein
MANRIPPSLKWLIDKRARVSGEIEKTRRSLKTAQALIKDLEDLEIKLKSIDTTLELHHIKVDVDLIDSIETKHLRLNIPHGELTRSILTCIRLYGENGPVSKVRIVDFIIARHFDGNAEKTTHTQISRSVQIRLKCLHRAGRLIRHHSAITSDYGLWSLPEIY